MKKTITTPDQLKSITEHVGRSKLPVTVEVKKYVETRSNPQNRLVHKWFGFVAKEYAMSTGKFYTLDMWKQYFKDMFGYWEDVEMLGKMIRRQKSTADYDVKEMSKFMESVDHYCVSELHIFVPSPGVPDNEY